MIENRPCTKALKTGDNGEGRPVGEQVTQEHRGTN